MDLLRQGTSLAFEVGPFFFAILLPLFFTVRARSPTLAEREPGV